MGNEILERMVGAETLEKLRWEVQSGEAFRESEPEPEYDPEERMDAIEVLLAHLNGAVRLINRFAKGNHEEQQVADEARHLKANLEEYQQIFEAKYREAEQDYIDNN